MWDEYAASIGTTANNLSQAQKIMAEVEGIAKETQHQMGDAAVYAGTYAGQVQRLSSAFFNLKTAVGSVIAPILQKLLPVITAAVNGLTKMFNKIQGIMAAFGYEWKEYYAKDAGGAISSATDNASNLSSGLDNTGDAAQKAAKKIKKAFAGVDEINVLNTNNDTSSGAGSSGGSGGFENGASGGNLTSAFEETEEKVKEKMELLSLTAYEWGYKLGQSINKGLEAIPWDKIQGTVNMVVGKVAEFLNGAVAGLNWTLLGTTFGNGFNTVLYGFTTWYETFNWAMLGRKLGEGVNGIISSVDFEEIGHFFSLKFNSIFTVASEFLGTVNWSNLGTKIINGLNTFVEELDFGVVGRTLQNGLNGAIDLMWNAVTEFDAHAAGSKLALEILP